jgi:hypothetical protein
MDHAVVGVATTMTPALELTGIGPALATLKSAKWSCSALCLREVFATS